MCVCVCLVVVLLLLTNVFPAIVPAAIWEILCVLETDERCHVCSGIFRNSGGVDEMHLLRARIEADEQIDWDKVEPNNIAGIFKMWLRELPEPLTTFDVYSIGVNVAGLEGVWVHLILIVSFFFLISPSCLTLYCTTKGMRG